MQQQLRRSAACQWLWGWMGGGAGGEGRRESGEGLWPWLWGGEAAHGQGPRRTQWRLALEDF